MGKLAGKVALVTGGSSGIGLGAAKRFAEEGAFVFIVGRRQAELEKAAAEIGHGASALVGDVSKPDDLDRIFAAIQDEKGHLDVLFANAGLGALEPLGKITEDSIDLVFGVNVKGTVLTVQKGLPLMQSGGSIILTGSTTGSRGTPAFSIYSASKAAVRNLARSWALDLKGTGIRVNVLSPGATDTPALNRLGERIGDKAALFASYAAQAPIGRMGSTEEVAAVALFLASDDSSILTGSEIFADGGSAQV